MRYAILVSLLLAGCAERAINTCPSPVVYSHMFMSAAAAELRQMPPGSPVVQLVVDYAQERAALRACHK